MGVGFDGCVTHRHAPAIKPMYCNPPLYRNPFTCSRRYGKEVVCSLVVLTKPRLARNGVTVVTVVMVVCYASYISGYGGWVIPSHNYIIISTTKQLSQQRVFNNGCSTTGIHSVGGVDRAFPRCMHPRQMAVFVGEAPARASDFEAGREHGIRIRQKKQCLRIIFASLPYAYSATLSATLCLLCYPVKAWSGCQTPKPQTRF